MNSIGIGARVFRRPDLDAYDLSCSRCRGGTEVRQVESAIGFESHVAGRKGQPRQNLFDPVIAVKPGNSSVIRPRLVTSRIFADPGTIGKVLRLPTRNTPSNTIAVGTMWPCDAEKSTSWRTLPFSGLISSRRPWFGSTA